LQNWKLTYKLARQKLINYTNKIVSYHVNLQSGKPKINKTRNHQLTLQNDKLKIKLTSLKIAN